MKRDTTLQQFNKYLTSIGIVSEEGQMDVRTKYGNDLNTMWRVMELTKQLPAAEARDKILSNGKADHSLLKH